MKVTILGCGSSLGVPIVGCCCKICKSEDPKNKRMRASIFIEVYGQRILVDTSPDLRKQLLKHNIDKIDYLIYTHAHADHLHGIDDLRAIRFFSDNDHLDVYSNMETLEKIELRFPYAFAHPINLKAHTISNYDAFDLAGVKVQSFEQLHTENGLKSLGYRIGDFAFSTDFISINKESLDLLRGVKTWVVEAIGYSKNSTHANLEYTLQLINYVKPERAILFHMNHEMDYRELIDTLPVGVEPAYDGMVIKLNT